jgi:YHS domain-containing protein
MTNNLEATASCCSTSTNGTNGASAAAPAVAANGRTNLMGGASDDMTTCPVMVGSPVSKQAAEAKGLYRDYEGERYYFCCAGCGPAFDSDPATYAANMA